MSIKKLSTDTSRLIGSSASITSPAAVVKELLDNAIDAGADAIEIAIAPNTIDQVRVRDNGRGVCLDNLDGLGRPAHTSKLGAFDELGAGRVRTLGFRGQALAHINSIAAAVDVITKTADEPVATKVRIDGKCGGVGRRGRPVSAPTGTTVLVTGLFSNMPPRRQYLLKESKNCMTKIKEMLVAYVLASADLRIVFKVLGEERQSCKLGYTRDRDLKQSVLEVFGAAVAANGETHRFAFGDSSAAGSWFTLVAFLPALQCDEKVMAGKGSYISVNGRPICSAVGIGKALTGAFKTKMQQQIWRRQGLQAVQRPLLLLEISCSFETYDANVATMKDDVLFADAGILLSTFEKLCDAAYDKAEALENDGKDVSQNDQTAVSELVSVQMRTACSVNMIRTNSNTTDEETDFKIVEAEVPARCLTEASWNQSRLSKDTIPKPARGIARYFQPMGPDFEIATDHTATSNKTEVESNNLLPNPSGSSPRRTPLVDVPDSALNILAAVQDSASDVSSSGDAPRLSNLNSTSWSIQNLVNRNMLQMPSRGSTAQGSRPSSVPLTRGQQERQQVLRNARLPILRTPPPSDSNRREELYPASVPNRAELDARRQPSPASSGSSQSGVPVKETRRIVQPRRVEMGTFPNTRNEQSHTRGSSSARLGRQPATRPMQLATAARPLARRPEYENSSDAASPQGGANGRGLMDYGSRIRSQLQQAASVYRETNDDMDSDVDHAEPQPKRPRSGSRGSVAMRIPNPRYEMPPLMKENVENLALESIPPSMATWCSILRTDVGFSDVRISMNLVKEFDVYVIDGVLGFGLRNTTKDDAVELECRVRQLCQV